MRTSVSELKRIEWINTQCYSAYGVRFGLQTNTPEGQALARPHLPLGWHEADGEQGDILYSLFLAPRCERSSITDCHLLYAGTELIARSADLEEVLQVLSEHTQLATMWHAREHLFVHAGTVGWRGRAILIPGRSWSGKTTLVKALVRAGASYYSDEYAVLDRRGYVHPYALPLSIRAANGHVAKTRIQELGGQTGMEPLPIALIVVTQYRPRAHWRPRGLSPAQAMLAVMDNTVAARREPDYTMPILREAVRYATVLQSPRGDAQRVALSLLEYRSTV